MQRVVFHFDVVSPYAYLAFERLPQVLAGIGHVVEYRPLLFAGLLAHWGQKGPAEIEPKRQWTFRQVHWLAARHGVTLNTPAQHPFNPLPLQRLLLACGPNRRTVEAVMRHVWCSEGAAADDPQRLAALTAELTAGLTAELKPPRDPAGDEVKAELRARTAEAAARGVFGVPTFELDRALGSPAGPRLFWGQDALEMLADALRGEPWFTGPAWTREGAPRPGVVRRD